MADTDNANCPIPGLDTWVTVDQIQRTVGRVIAANSDESGTRLKVDWMRPRDSPPSWHDPTELGCGFMPGQEVRHAPHSLVEAEPSEGVVRELRTIAGRDQALVEFPETGQITWLPFQHLHHLNGVHQRFLRGTFGKDDVGERFRLRTLAHLLEMWHENTGALSHLDIDPLPHQIHVVHKILRSGNLNWMIADDVGLGKTIEVGMLLSALKARGVFRRILIVCPPGVMLQWQEELRNKFSFDDFLVYGRDFDIYERHHWKLYDHVIGSMDRLKGEEHIDALLAAGAWDLVVIDEAHRLTRRQYGEKYYSSQRFEFAKLLRRRTESMMLLTATPHQGMQDSFQALLELLRPERKRRIQTLELNPHILGDMIVRNHKADVTDAQGEFIFKGKTTKALSVEVSNNARRFDHALQNYVRRGYHAAKHLGRQGMPVGFVMTVYRKLSSSSIAAIHQALKRRRARLQADATYEARWRTEEQAHEPTDDAAQRYAGELEELRAEGQPHQFFEGELAALDELIARAEDLLANDQKLTSFIERLVEIVDANRRGEPILIFTEYRATQDYLESALTERFGSGSVELIHGGQKQQERRDAIQRFERSAQFLISTEAGGEGINLHRRCHLMVNYDLPWNPMRLVQRIGRLYRYGQTKRVVVFNVHAPDTIDADIVRTMYNKLLQICSDMATVGDEFKEGLDDEILGDMANIADLDIQNILTEASTEGVNRTNQRISETLEVAQSAAAKQKELFAYVSGYDPDDNQQELEVSRHHLRAFVEGMLPHNDIEIVNRRHGDMVWELKIPEEVRRDLPEFKTHTRVTFDRTWAADRSDIHMLDMRSPLVQILLGQAKRSDFGGRVAAIRCEGTSVITAFLRWQNNHARRMRQEFVAIQISDDGWTVTNPDAFSQWLLHPATTTDAVPDKSRASTRFQAAESAAEARLAALADMTLQPENCQWIAAAWPG